jgi:diguanylate cyclase (GGDEF)-like protein
VARVLVVEDSPTQADWVRQVLVREGYEVQLASNGREAVRAVRAQPPDLVLLDMILPDMDGLQVLRILKSRSDDDFVPVILISVKADLDSRVKGLRIGADDFLAKPFAEAEVQARAAAMLRIKSLQDQLRAAKAQLERLSVTDGLTGLYNRRFFQERLKEEFSRAQRYGDALSLMILDLDRFKRVNDQYGHPFGDEVLRGTAEIVRGSTRDVDLCTRYGGEELAVILPRTPMPGAIAVAERFVARMREKVYAAPGTGAEVRVTASAGVASSPAIGVATWDDLLHRADEALYRAKHEGRDRACAHQPPEAARSAGGEGAEVSADET